MQSMAIEVSKFEFREAQREDCAAIAQLVNSAYRGDFSRKGWTTEADLLGGQRTDVEKIEEMLQSSEGVFLLAFRKATLLGSVYLEKKDATTAYLGMFAVNPELQNLGIGRAMLQEAEFKVRQWWRSQRMIMTVIPLREELIAWYERRGYKRTNEVQDFPKTNPRFGLPLRADLSLEVLEKYF
jgi:ribosomal protein S18 acetylase RimI-like enzyme